MSRCENGFHLRKMGLDCLSQCKPVRGLDKNLRDENIAPGMQVDPFHCGIRICCGPGFRPTEFPKFCREALRRGSGTVNNQYFHWASCLR